MSNLPLLQEWYSRVWEAADLDAIDDLFSPQVCESGLLTDLPVSPEEFRELVPALLALVTDPKFTVGPVVESDNWLAASIKMTALSATDLSPVCATGQVMIRVQDNRIVEVHNQFDFLGFFEKLGLLPENTTMLCLSGERLA